MKHFVAVIAVLLAAVAVGQEVKHAPTAAQCQADQRLWASEQVNQLIVYEKVPTMQNQMLEMMDCISVDPTHENDYRSVLDATTSVIALRALQFIDRHGLWQQFVDEDTAGER